MDSLTEAQLAEQIAIYEARNKALKEEIKGDLRLRKELKQKIDEAKHRETTQILTLERLREYEKIASERYELIKNMKDEESLRGLATVAKYESMLREQEQVWAGYKEQYEQLPLAKERAAAEVRLLNLTIKNKLVLYKIAELKRNMKLKAEIDTKLEQVQIIRFAELYVEHKKREKRYAELETKYEASKARHRQLTAEIEELEKQVQMKESNNSCLPKTSIATQKLPQVDFSAFVVSTASKVADNFDTMSINSFMLEQEYMNTDEPTKQMANDSREKLAANQAQTRDEDSISVAMMDIDNSQDSHLSTSKNQSHVQQSQASNEQLIQSNRANQQQKTHQLEDAKAKKESSQDVNQEVMQTTDAKGSAKRAHQQSAGDSSKIEENRQAAAKYLPKNERPIPSPVKMPKHSPQDENISSGDLSKLPQANKPSIKTVESVNFKMSAFQLKQSHHQQHQQTQEQQQQFQMHQQFLLQRKQLEALPMSAATPSMIVPSNLQNPATPITIRTPQQRVETPSLATLRDDSSLLHLIQHQTDVESIDMDNISGIAPNLMSSDVMGDVNMDADNISDILGSEFTEKGGSFELVKKLHGDSDVNSEGGDVDYDNLMMNFGSPIAPRSTVKKPEVAIQLFTGTSQSGETKPNTQQQQSKFFFF